MSNQLQITGGAKVRNLDGVITGSTGVLGSLPINGANGIPQLDSSGKILVSQLPNSVMEYKGTWNVTTNTPYLVNGTGNTGDVYLVTGAATGGTSHNFGAGAITFYNGDQAIYDGSQWQRGNGATGTVTSVAVTESSDALSITGSPITTSGTINIGFAGTSAQYVAGNGSLITFPTLTGYVPYTGATNDVDLGTHKLTLNSEQFNSISAPTYSEGALWYDSTQKALAYYNDVTNNILHIGQEVQLKVHNNTGSSIAKGAPVYVTSTSSGYSYPNVALAKADTLTTANVIGLANQAIANGADGYITLSGLLTGANTGSFTVGDVLYLSPYSAGQLMNTMPPTGYAVRVGVVSYSNTPNGTIYINQSNAYSTAANIVGTIQISQGGTGATTAGGALTNLGAASSSRLISTTTPLQGGGDLSADRTLSILQAGTSQSGYLSSTDWNTFNNKQNALGYVPIGGSGSINYISKFTGSTTISQSGIYEGVTNYVSIGNTNTTYNLDVTGTSRITGQLTLGSTITNGTYTYTLPGATGTLALTSQIPSLSGYVTGTATSGQVSYFNGTSSIAGSNNHFWDAANNRLGIGLTNPQRSLEIYSATADSHLRLSGAAPSVSMGEAITGSVYQAKFGLATGSGQYVSGAVAGDFVIISQTGATIWANSGGERMRLTSGGSLGIGTSSPSYPLSVNGSSSAWVVTAQFLNSYGNRDIRIGTDSSNGENYIQGYVTSTNATRQLSINPYGGNVGIGTTSPTNISGFTSLTLNNTTNGGIVDFQSSGTGVGRIINDATTFNVLALGSTAPLILGAGGSEKMRITSGGYVGIGTSSPKTLLDVYYNGDIWHTFIGGGTSKLLIGGQAGSGGVVLQAGNASTANNAAPTTTYNMLLQRDGGQVLIGSSTSAAGQKLEVTGGVYLTSSLLVKDTNIQYRKHSGADGVELTAGVGGVYLDYGMTGWGSLSDERLKNIDSEILNATESLMTLRTIKYSLKNDDRNKINLGLIAQEVKKVFPEIVDTQDDEIGTMGVRYTELIPVLIKAIQELKAEIDELKNK